MSRAGTPAAYRCSCRLPQKEQVDLLIAGTRGAYICEECVEGAWEVVQESRRAQAPAGQEQEGPAAREEER